MGAPPREWILRVLVASAIVAVIATIWSSPAPLALRGLTLLLLAGLLLVQAFRFIPSFDPLGRIRWRLPAVTGPGRQCAITFDDGPSAATEAVLDILATEGVRATFFVLGSNVERFPALVQRAHAEGHAIGLHGMDHTKLTGAAESAVEAQVGGLAALLRRLDISPAPVYRTPHGRKSRSVFRVAARHRLTLWAWTRGVWDTDKPDPAVLLRRATRAARSGMVLLLHDGRGDEPQPDVTATVAALPLILRELKQRGFTFIRLADV